MTSDKINLRMDTQEIFGLLAPNGTGKTKKVRMLRTIIQPTDATAETARFDICRDPHRVQRSMGVVSEASTIAVELTASENMNIHAKYHGVPTETRTERIRKLLDVADLALFTCIMIVLATMAFRRALSTLQERDDESNFKTSPERLN